MQKLTIEYIESLIDHESFQHEPKVMICKLHVGESVFVGEAHCFDQAQQNISRAKGSARRNAIDKIFAAEAYHLKRERDALNIQYGIKHLQIYKGLMHQGVVLRLTSVNPMELNPGKHIFTFEIISHHGTKSSLDTVVDCNFDISVAEQLQALIQEHYKNIRDSEGGEQTSA